MTMDGKLVSAYVKENVKQEVEGFIKDTGVTPALAVVVVGNDPASAVYVRNKHRACLAVGIASYEYALPEETTESELLALIRDLNQKPEIHGILVQLPLPRHISEEKVLLAIDPKKDVDAFHPTNVGRLVAGNYDFLPCTPAGVMELLRYYKTEIDGKHCVILGRSNIVGKPMAHLMLEANATVTVCHSHTKNLADITRQADILVVAIGKAEFVHADMVKPGAVVIDVGINRLPDGALAGDVATREVEAVASAITPVPGGVGPMTIAILMKNTLTAVKKQILEEK
ncbi:MAG: bifunctional methylenetetrahydrofolate dehydrogenase/methenyltetrahydrofolate cyclohydrolase FolD [Clostridia bacterium]|nr:bifunctional methylenetetrahydrofolate dehydrogenase/methenyltetrahydrofolate cyclohydrolase FolD [Clostridia bacterium]